MELKMRDACALLALYKGDEVDWRRLAGLRRLGLVEKEGKGVYSLTPKGRALVEANLPLLRWACAVIENCPEDAREIVETALIALEDEGELAEVPRGETGRGAHGNTEEEGRA